MLGQEIERLNGLLKAKVNEISTSEQRIRSQQQ
jgi:hypothetical protein